MFAVQSLVCLVTIGRHVASHLDRNGERAAVAERVVQVSVDVLSARSAAHHHHAERQDDHGQCERSISAHVRNQLRQYEDGDFHQHHDVQKAARAGAVTDGRPLQSLHLHFPCTHEVHDREHACEKKNTAWHADGQIVALSQGHACDSDRHRCHCDGHEGVQRPLRDLDVERDWASPRLCRVSAPSAPLCAVHHVPRTRRVALGWQL